MGPIAQNEAMEEQRRVISALLEKRVTFHQGLKELGAAVQACAPNNTAKLDALMELLPRTMTLLKTRYTNPTQWKAAAEVYRILESYATTASQKARVQQYLADAEAFLTEHDTEMPAAVAISTEAAAAAALANIPMADLLASLGPGLLQTGTSVEAHYDDTGPILDDPERRRRAEGAPAADTAASAGAAGQADTPTPAIGTGGDGGGDRTGEAAVSGVGGGGGVSEEARRHLQRRAELQRAILDGMQAVYSGMEAVARGTEVVERELESVLAALGAAGRGGAPSRPPASRRAVAALPRLVLDEATLEARLGRGAVCPVCTEPLAPGDEVQLLPCPCKHGYHVPCLAPWLAQSNACPLCRKELLTDDPAYEARKEREAEEAAERAGAVNALSHNEFAYI